MKFERARRTAALGGRLMVGGLLLAQPAAAETELFSMGAAMRHAVVASQTEIVHQDLISEGTYLLKNINKVTAGANRTYLANGTEAAWGDLVLEHTVGVVWEGWVELVGPATLPAKGMDDTLVIEATYTVGTSAPEAGSKYNIGISGRSAASYNNVIFWPNVFATGVRETAPDAGAAHTVRFEIQPTNASATVFLNGEQVGQQTITGDPLTWLSSEDLGFVRIYFQSMTAAGGGDNAALGTTQTFTIDQIRVYQLGGSGGGGNGGGGGEDLITPLFGMGDGAFHANGPAVTEVLHGDFINEGDGTLKNINQSAGEGGNRTVLTDGDSTSGYRTIQLIHNKAVQWNSWLEYQVPASFPAAGADHKVVFETKFKVESSDTNIDLKHAVGFAARSEGAYGEVMFLPDKLATPYTQTATVNGVDQVVKFVIEPSKGTGTVYLNDAPLGTVTLVDPALGYITNKNLGFVRLYFKSSGAGGGNDNALLGATQTISIDYIKAYIIGTPVITIPTLERNFVSMDQSLFNASDPGATVVKNNQVIRQGEDDLRFKAGLSGVQAALATATATGHHEIRVTQTVAVNGETTLGFDYPYDFPARGRKDPLLIEIKMGVSLSEGLSGVLHGLTLSAKALNATGDVILAPGVFGILPRATQAAHSALTTYTFEINPETGVAEAYQGTDLLFRHTLPEDKAALLRDNELTELRLHFHGKKLTTPTSGMAMGGSQTFAIDKIRVFQRDEIITREQVAAAFTASGLEGVHPRLLTSPAGLQEVADLIQSDSIVSGMYGGVLSVADSLSSKDGGGNYINPPREWALDEANLRIPNIHGFHIPVGNLATAYLLTGDAKYAERIWAQIEMMNNDYPDFGVNRHQLDTGVACANYGIAYDALQNWLTAEQKTAMWNAIRVKGLIPLYNGMRSNSWWHTSPQNWNAVIHGGVILAALAFYEQDPAFCSEVLTIAANGCVPYIDEFFPDGATEEGAVYWGYGLSYFGYGIQALYNVLGTDFGLSDSLGIERTRYFPYLISGPVATLNFGDDDIKGGVGGTLLWLARRYADGALIRNLYERWQNGESGNWHNLLTFRPDEMAAESTGPADLENHVRGQDVISLIESWTDPDAMFVAIHGGSNNASHGHLDAGSFYIQAGGNYFAFGNLGGDDYNSPGFFTNTAVPAYAATTNITTQGNQSRWHFYNTRAEGKNALVFKPRSTPGDVRPDQNPDGAAIVNDISAHAQESFAVLNLQPVYSRDVSHYERGIRLWGDRKVITVQDEFTPKADSTVYWGLHTRAPVLILDGGKTARLFGSGGNLFIHLRSPADATFTVQSPLTYLPGESFPQTDNRRIPTGMKKLLITLDVDANQSETIRVDCRMDATPDAVEQWPMPLGDWGSQADWPDAVGWQDFYTLSSWMGWFAQGPGGWIYSVETGSWLYSLPRNQRDSFYGWSPAHNAWFWTSRHFWPWAYRYTQTEPGWTIIQPGAL